MPNNIHVLSKEQAQQIAAGEVIERPANIVKELLENSIDAGAQTITIKIEKAGKQLISITDDGCGMSKDDAQLCFARHATSKLRCVDQLMSLETFGFRGEALASIAAVSKVMLTTKQHNTDAPLGTRVSYQFGAKTEVESVACSAGTSIVISDLFATLPVRKTFLKQDETEWNQIMAAITGLALTYIDRTIKVFKDGSLFLNAPKVTTLKDRITQLWGHHISSQLHDIQAPSSKSGITLSGLASLPPYARYGKQQVIFFVNNRLVKNNDLSKAIVKGYKQSLPPGKYPAVCLFITTDKSDVDVNIHPRKEEVRFTKPGVVARVIQEAITTTLEHAVSSTLAPVTAPRITPEPFKVPDAKPFAPQTIIADLTTLKPTSVQTSAPLPLPQSPASQTQPAPEQLRQASAITEPEQPKQSQETTVTATSARVIGQIFATYIIIELDNSLIMVDQHAAHERILYHQFANNFTGKQGTRLLFPETISLNEKEIAAITAHQSFLHDQGIDVHQSGPGQLAITSSPPKIQSESLKELLTDMADFIITHESLDQEQFMRRLNEHVHSHMSCKAAVRARDVLDQQMMESLIQQLLKTPNRFMCVHGRPTMWPISRIELEKKFRRRT